MNAIQMIHEVPLPITEEPVHEFNEDGDCWCQPTHEKRSGPKDSTLWVVHQDHTGE